MDSISLVVSAWSRLLDGRPSLAIGSGTWGIACLLEALSEIYPQKRILLPSFLCPNPLAAALYSNWQPVFCDVDPVTAMPCEHDILAGIDKGVDVVLAAHMFGHVMDMRGIDEICKSRGVFLIEDACQAVGARYDRRLCGSYGDISVVSFGHSKQINAGGGAVLACEDRGLLSRIAELDRAGLKGHTFSDRANQNLNFSSDFYVAKSEYEAGNPAALSGLAQAYLPLVPCDWDGSVEMILAGLEHLESRTLERQRKYCLYIELLNSAGIEALLQGEHDAPWRFCFRLPGIDRPQQVEIAEKIRRQGMDVSNWYLPSHLMVSAAAEQLPGTEILSTEIFQLWLDESVADELIENTAQVVRNSLP